LHCENEAEQKYLNIPTAKAITRPEKYCNASSRTTQCIRNESNDYIVYGALPTPGKTWKCPNADVSDSDEQVVKDITEDFIYNK
jgi:hypothetical protein